LERILDARLVAFREDMRRQFDALRTRFDGLEPEQRLIAGIEADLN
jgi:hypothetical protein